MKDDDFIVSDFTVISNWETFTSDLESLVNKWKPFDHDGSATINYKGTEISVSLHYTTEHVSILEGVPRFSVSTSAANPLDYIARVFGMEKFLFMKCSEDSWMTLATARLLLSSAIMALRTRKCRDLTAFVEFGEGNVMGLNEGEKFSLSCLSLDQIVGADQSYDKSSIFRRFYLDQFKGISGNELQISYCITLSCRTNGTGGGNFAMFEVPWGCGASVESLELSTIFPRIENGLVIAGLLPEALEAPIWMLTANYRRDRPTRLAQLVRSLTSLLQLSRQSMTDPRDMIHSKSRMYNFFPPSSSSPSPSLPSSKPSSSGDDWSLYFRFIFLASDDQRSMPLRLISCVLLILTRLGSDLAKVVDCLWTEFGSFWKELTTILREYWISATSLPGCPMKPDLNCTLLEQKLAMLNFCINRELEYLQIPGHQPVRTTVGPSVGDFLDRLAQKHQEELEEERRKTMQRFIGRLGKPPGDWRPKEEAGDKIEEEEYFDPIDEDFQVTADEAKSMITKLAHKTIEPNDSANPTEREGHKVIHPSLNLLKDHQTSIWIPYTQEPGPITSDMLAHLENPSNVTREEKRYAYLISDMQAFKAANSTAEFVDFVRWHSPRDFQDGVLSQRMNSPGNVWLQLWGACAPQPIVRQRLLFDHRTEAEKTLFWFENASLLLPLTLDCIAMQMGVAAPLQNIDEPTLAEYVDVLNGAENKLSLRRQLVDILPGGLDMEPLLEGDPILVAQETAREAIAQLFSGSRELIDRELIISNSSRAGGPLAMYIRIFDNAVELALNERV